MRFGRVPLVLCAAFLFSASPVSAQTVGVTTGAINGSVTDTSDAVLPGVSVELSGTAQMGVQSAITDERGAYRFPGLPPGEYRLAYQLAGFGTTVRDHIQVSIGFTATVNTKLGVAAVEETLTVQGASPVVDASATRIQTNYSAERLASIPNARDIWAIMAASPAVRQAVVDVGGASAGSQSQFVTYGTRAQNQPMIEGMLMSQIGSAGGSVTFYYDYGSFQEVSVNAAGNSADMAMPGVQFQFISKSGGNRLRGNALVDVESENIQATDIDASQLARGIASTSDNRLHQFYDTNADAGGPIRRDKVWWYGSFRDERSQARYPNFTVQPFETRLTNYTGKLTTQVTPRDKFILYGQGGKKLQPYRQDTATIGGPGGSRSFAIFGVNADATANQDYYGWVWKGEYDRVLSSNAFAEIRAGRVGYTWKSGNYSNEVRREDIGNLQVSGGNTLWTENVNRNQLLGSLSLFKSGWAGSHNFKTGFEIYRDTSERDQTGYPANLLLEFNNGVATAVREYQPSSGINRLLAGGLYITDAWNVGKRLQLNLGARVDHYRSYLPAQSRPASQFATAASFPAADDVITWNLPAPRFGVTYKIDEAGKTVIKANAGRYWWNPDVNVASSVNPNLATAFERYAWTDPNGDRSFQSSEQGRLLSRTGGSALTLDPNLQNTYTDELATWLDHELMPNFELRTGLIWRGQRQLRQTINVAQPFSAFNVPVQVRDPGPDGRAGTADDGSLLSMMNLAAANLGQVNSLVMNVPSTNDYYTWEVTANRRMTGWSLMASYAVTWNMENAASPGAAANPVRTADSPVNPNDLINAGDDGRYHFTLWNAKVHAVIPGPWHMQFAPLVRAQSGQPFGRTFVATMNYGSQRVLAEPLGTQQQQTVAIADLRVERIFSLPGSRKISAQLDFYNLFNSNPEDFITWGSGSSYLRPSSVIPPRIVRFGVRVDW